MASALYEALDWLKGSKYGYKLKDKAILFIYILNATIILILTYSFFGKDKDIEIYFHRNLLLNWLPFKSVVIQRDGVKLYLPMIIDYIVLVKSDWEKEERAFLIDLDLEKDDGKNNNSFVMDVGANIGYYTILFAKRHPGHKVISIEPSKRIFRQLKQNCNLNNIEKSRLILINKASADVDNKETEFYEIETMSTTQKDFMANLPISGNNNNNDQLFAMHRDIVETTTIDGIVDSENVESIPLLKVDVEGAEIMTLKGAAQTLKKKKIRMIMIEYHSHENHNYIINLLRELGYSVQYSSKQRPAIHKDPKYVNGHIIAKLE
jgi:FkbM family methyltransferase